MIRINLLPIRQIKKKRQLQQEMVGFGIVVAVLAIILVFFGRGLTRKVEAIQLEISDLEATKQKYNKVIAEIKQLEQAQALLEKKISIIRDLKKNTQINVRVLDELANITPSERLWLNSFQHTGDRLVLNGIALDNSTIAIFMERLESSPYFAEPELASSNSNVVGGNKLQSFSLTINIVNPAASADQPAG